MAKKFSWDGTKFNLGNWWLEEQEVRMRWKCHQVTSVPVLSHDIFLVHHGRSVGCYGCVGFAQAFPEPCHLCLLPPSPISVPSVVIPVELGSGEISEGDF